MTRFSWEKSATSNNYQSDEWKELDKVVGLLNSIDLIGLWPYKYITVGKTYAETPERTLSIGGGDCDDTSRFYNYLLLKNGYNLLDYDNLDIYKTNSVAGLDVKFNKPFSIPSLPNALSNGHSVLLFKMNNTLGYMDAKGARLSPFNTVEEIADRIGSMGGGYSHFTLRDMDWNATKTVYKH